MDDNHASSSKAALSKLTPRVRRLLVFLVLLGTAAVVWLCWREPRFHGQSASYWLDHTASETDVQAAVTAFKAMGKSGTMFLVETITAKRSQSGSSLLDKLAESRLPMPESLRAALVTQPPPAGRWSNALRILGSLVQEAEVALPRLMKEYNAMVNAGQVMPDWDVIMALEAVGDAKAKYIPDFIRALQSNWEPTALDAALLLGSIGPKAKVAVPELLEQMPAGSWQFSNVVAETLWKIDRQTNLVLGVFTNELLTVRDKEVPLRSLREMRLAGNPAAPLVLQQFTNTDERVRTAAARTLSEIAPDLYHSTLAEVNQNPTASVERLTQAIRGNALERSKALEVIAMYGPDAKPALPALIEILLLAPPRGSIPSTSWENAVEAVAEIGPDARSAVPALLALLPAKRIYFSPVEICRALGNIGPGANSAVPTLKQYLRSSSPWDRIVAATALARIAPEEKASLAPVLKELTNSTYRGGNLGKDPRFCWTAKVALWRLGLEKEPPIAEMMPPLESWSVLVAIPLLGDIGPPAKAALPYLQKILESDTDVHLRRKAAIAIKKIDPRLADKLQLPGLLALP
jgi:HEAT repeat protein